jgi:hypothetical protein
VSWEETNVTSWQKSITLKNLRADHVPGFECYFINKPEQIAGTLQPFKPKWWVQYLDNGTMEIFDTLKEAQQWVREWGEI